MPLSLWSAKLEIEKVAAEVGAFVVRPGLVYGDPPSGGMFGALQRSARSAVIPIIGRGVQLQYLVHEDDLCEMLFQIIMGDFIPSAPLVAAAPQGWQMRELLRVLSIAHHAKARFVQIPWCGVWLALKFPELLGIPLPFRSDSVISLVWQDPSPDFSLSAKWGFRFREFKNVYGSELPSTGSSNLSSRTSAGGRFGSG
jgi:NAD dependent epimerase/dehydratase family enzyme